MPTNKAYIGIIAQEMKEIAPYMVGTFKYQDANGNTTEYLDYNPNALNYILVNALKEQKKLIEEKKNRITKLKNEMNEIIKAMCDSGIDFNTSGNSK